MSEIAQQSIWKQIFSYKMLLCVFTGFTSGLPLYFLYQLIPAWLRSEQVDLKTIGFFALIGLPYTWKFLVAPLFDRYYPNFLGRRRSWMFFTQIILLLLIACFGFFNPTENIKAVMALAAAVAFASAVQDIVVDAYRREILADEELGLGNSIHINGYRIAGLIPGGLALIVSDHYSWDIVFIFTALFMIPGLILSLFLSKEPEILEDNRHLPFREAFVIPFKEFFHRKGLWAAIGTLLFMLLYNLGDSFAATLQSAFILDMGFSRTDLGTAVKINGLWASIVAGMLGGVLMLRIGVNRSLWIFGLFQMLMLLGFAWLASHGRFEVIGAYERFALSAVIIGEYIGIGLGTACFVAYISRETNPLYTATQFAIFTSLTAIPSKLIGATSGALAESVGFYQFYWICFFLAIPGMLCLFWVAPWNGKKA
ncbi:AmpG family muropeptide MFS transporter [Glaesserella sp.]|uniref:AmpG family muropeptide MFS transporter n=1 Tax=Glaesserella sp. TaxID=2094731 RepID=UPI0035A1B5C8